MKTKKLPNEKYLRIFDEQFIEWITEIMSQEKMKYANAQDVAHEIEISNVEENSIFDAVQQDIYNHQVLFYEVEFERELNFIEKSKIKEWVAKGQRGKLNL